MRNTFKTLILLAAVTLACSIVPVYGEPAHPKPALITMPDGSRLTVHLYGDDFGSYTATSDGYEVVRQPDGFYYYATLDNNVAVPTRVVAKEVSGRGPEDYAVLSRVSRPGHNSSQRLNAMRVQKKAELESEMTPERERTAEMQREMTRSGEVFKSLVILVNFKDVAYTTPSPKTAVHNLLNQRGYSENDAIGSAYDYYHDNSNGRFNPQFDIVGPYTLSQNMEYYGASYSGGNDIRPRDMVMEACNLASANGVDFSPYLIEGTSTLKEVYIFYAGYAQSYSGNDSNCIWPHRWTLPGFSVQGYTLPGYACSSEFWGWQSLPSQRGFTGIGTFCHEYGHVLGWPDFYDTNSGTNGTAIHLEKYSLMSGGNHNARGRKPPALRAIERKLMGWLDQETPLLSTGRYELEELYDNDKAYIMDTKTSGEYYLFETMSTRRNKWDSGIYESYNAHVEGMLVTHVDKSSRVIPGIGYTAQYLWNMNRLNAYSVHPCARIVKAVGTAAESAHQWIFPQSGVNSLSGSTHSEFIDWSGNSMNRTLSDIMYSSGKVSFTMTSGNETMFLELSDTSISLPLNGQHALNATVYPPGAYEGELVWKSSDPTVATVNNGLLTGIGSGYADITVTTADELISAVCKVTVNAAQSAKISEAETIPLGTKRTLAVTVSPEGSYIPNVAWTTSNADIATVEDGVVTGVGEGQANITVKSGDGSISAACRVTVINEISGIKIISAYQNDAELSWANASHSGKFKLTLYRNGTQQKEWTTDEKYAYIPLLQPASSYSLKVTSVYSDLSEGSSMSQNFSTQATTHAYPSIMVKGYYSSGTEIPLRILHTSSKLKSVVWYVDGEKASPPGIKLSSGRHELTVTITNDDGYVEKITKYITVN